MERKTLFDLSGRIALVTGASRGIGESVARTLAAAVAVTGVTLALGVMTWTFSAIKFQADMGLLLAFMFVWSMVGAIVLIPALVSLLMPHLRRSAAAPSSPSMKPCIKSDAAY